MGVMTIEYNGAVGYMYFGYTKYGFRPIICLKSDVQLEKEENGKYRILD